MLLSHYYRPEIDPDVERAQMKDWFAVLSPFPQEAVEYACAHYLRNQPNRRPTPAEIRNRAVSWMEAHRPPAIPKMDEPPRERITAERAAEICAEYGFTPDLSQMLKRFPRATSRAEAERLNQKPTGELPPEAYMTEAEMKERGLA